MKNAENRRKILIILYYYHPYVSGVSVYAKRLAEGLVNNGNDVTIFTSRFDKKLPKYEIINGVKIIRHPVLFRFSKGVIMPTFWLKAIYLSRKFDYFNPHLPMPDTGISSLFIHKKKIITTYQCDINLLDGLLNKLVVNVSYILMNIQLRRSKAIVTLNNDYFIHSKVSKYIYKTTQIYPAIYTSDFRHSDPSSLANRLALESNQIKIGFVGRIVYEKGIKYLLECIPILDKEIDNYMIIIAGDYNKIAGGGIKNELDIYLSNYPNKIIFTGYLSDIDLKKFYSLIDVLVLPSIDPLEAFGMVQVEAMLCGTPVVASDMPGVREVIKKTGYGLISKPKNPVDISEKIIEIVKNPSYYKPIRSNVTKIFNPKITIKEYEDLMS